MAISEGDTLPDGIFRRLTEDGLEERSVRDMVAGRKVLLIGMPGAYTNTCSGLHMPSLVRQADAIRERWRQMGQHLGPSDAVAAPHVWLAVDGDAEEAATQLRQCGVAVVPAETFASGRPFHSRVRASLTAAPTSADLDTALAILADFGARTAALPRAGGSALAR